MRRHRHLRRPKTPVVGTLIGQTLHEFPDRMDPRECPVKVHASRCRRRMFLWNQPSIKETVKHFSTAGQVSNGGMRQVDLGGKESYPRTKATDSDFRAGKPRCPLLKMLIANTGWRYSSAVLL